MTTTIDRATAQDVEAIVDLVQQSALPLDGLSDHLHTAVVARANGRVVGSAALEVYADGALLRSVAVSPEYRHSGVGRQLTDAAIQLARELMLPGMYLLTTTAEDYFPRFGFERIDRAQVPRTVQASVEFTSACPASAIVMRKRLRD